MTIILSFAGGILTGMLLVLVLMVGAFRYLSKHPELIVKQFMRKMMDGGKNAGNSGRSTTRTHS